MSIHTAASSGVKRIYAQNPADLGRWSPQGRKVFLDIETASDGPKGGLERNARVVLITVYDGRTVMMADTRMLDARLVLDLITDLDMQVIGHNLKFDLGHLLQYGFRPKRLYDTMLAEQLLNLGRDVSARLDVIVPRYLRRGLDKNLATSFGVSGPFSSEQLEYAANDVLVLEPIYMAQREHLAKAGLIETAKLEFELLPVLVDMEAAGIMLDVPGARAELARLEAEALSAEARVSELLTPIILRWRARLLERRDSERAWFLRNVNEYQARLEETITMDGFETRSERRREINRLMAEFRKTLTPDGRLPAPYHFDAGPISMTSRDQMLTALNELLGPTGQYLADVKRETIKATMDLVEDDQVASTLAMYMDWKELHKLITGTMRPLLSLKDERDRVCTSFTQMVRTGRLASSEPNLQNVPVRTERGKRIRRLFRAAEGNLLTSADYSQIELRVLAVDIFRKTGGRTLLDIFLKGDQDVHAATAAMMYEVPYEDIAPEDGPSHHLRREAKTINFGLLFGMSKFGLGRDLGISPDDAQVKMDLYFDKLPDVAAWASYVEEEAATKGYAQTMIGRKRYTPALEEGLEYRALQRWWGHQKRIARNMPIQGTAADIMKLALINLHDALKDKGQILLTVHDEVVIEHPAEYTEEVARVTDEVMVASARSILKECPVVVDVETGPTWS